MSAFSIMPFMCSIPVCAVEHIVALISFLMPVAQRLPLDPVHPFESRDEEQGHYANVLNVGKEGEAVRMLW